MITYILFGLVYAFIGSIIAGRHHALSSRICKYSDGIESPNRYGGGTHLEDCWGPSSWCTHITMSIWFYGALWFVALPITAGYLIGSTDKSGRIEKRRAREIAEAKHQTELARIRREEDEELDRQLSRVRKPA